jgi:hypothetical protein
MTDPQPTQADREVASSLFVNGAGQQATRLVMTDAKGHDLGGWCEGAVRDVIARHMAPERERAERIEEECARWKKAAKDTMLDDVPKTVDGVPFHVGMVCYDPNLWAYKIAWYADHEREDEDESGICVEAYCKPSDAWRWSKHPSKILPGMMYACIDAAIRAKKALESDNP